ncbi:amidohydrolase family protein [Pseudonocardia endophytica]|uniref:Imidazolonepropionase-like amidohydrolase n=1 Tax=Pseudonocardia endophytica TaxID=401976 RepID=A0A4R1HU41_PSEEN|nr:amidohydrolase family protein [Pseudonocardia endophytica]TCK26204.1 imidazolonepropionase-like amidohydrolase [Pseudonocardia endophytica]
MSHRLITADRVVTAPGEPVVPHGAVLVDGDTIVAVGTAADLEPVARDAERWDVRGGTVQPGLLNAHVHLSFRVDDDPVPSLRDRDHDALRRAIAANARACVEAGVTTVRDLGDRDGLVSAFRDDVAAGRADGPRVLTAQSPLTVAGGHCWFLGGEIDVDAHPSDVVLAIRDAVTRRAAAGADVIKVMAGGGRMTPSGAPMWQSQFGLRDLRAVVDAAAGHGLPVAAHAHGTHAMGLAARAGVTTIEHGGWHTAPGPDGGTAHFCDDAVAEAIAASGAVVVPTRFRGWRDWPADAGLQGQIDRTHWSRGHGIAMIAGNDAGVGRGWFDDLTDALTYYRAAGVPAAEVLDMATTGAAAALGVGDRTGRLAPGLAADVLAVGGDPLADTDALRDVRGVLAAGRAVRTPA